MSSCTTFIPSRFLTRSVASECRKVCQPTCFVIPALIAAGRSCRCNAASNHNRSAYYDLLDRVRTRGDWEAWLDFFLTGVQETAEQAATAARHILALFEADREKIEGL